MRTTLLIVLCLLSLSEARAQKTIPLKGDLKGAPYIRVNQLYSFPKSPSGFGNIKEFKLSPSRNKIIFREERNTCWFLIDVPFSGILTFDLIPHQLKDDYDWMLFENTPDLEKNLRNETVVPFRTNNARNATVFSSKTGMRTDASSKFTKPGPGNNYSMPLKVKNGDKLALVLDNIYGGKGFDIMISVKPAISGPMVILEGTVKGRYFKETLAAEITVEDDSTGVFIGKVFSDSQSGSYRIKVPINRPLNITASHPSYVFSTRDTLISENSNLDFLLDTPASGRRMVLNNIHFLPNKDEIVPSSFPELNRLLVFMKEKPDYTVKIIGHTNPNVFTSARYLQQLSFNRALAVKNYLTSNAIAEKRISCAGLGGKMPVVVTNDLVEGLKNLRVEITLRKK